MRYAINCLNEPALDQILLYVETDRVNLAGLIALINVLKAAFGDPNRRRNAERKILTLRMGNRDFASYYAEFQRYAAEAEWDEKARLATLRAGISQSLAHSLIVRGEPTDLVPWVALCQELDGNLRTHIATYGTRNQRPASPN